MDKAVTDQTSQSRLSPHFTVGEFACPHCGLCWVSERLLEGLESFRAAANRLFPSPVVGRERPVVVLSGCRCDTYNSSIALASPNSHHLTRAPAGANDPGRRCQAADVRLPRVSNTERPLTVIDMLEAALAVAAFREGGIGLYDGGFLHLDVRSQRHRYCRVQGHYTTDFSALLRPR